MSATRALLLAGALAIGCGGSSGAGEPGPVPPAPPRCGATCDRVSLRGPLAAASLDGGTVVVAARSVQGAPLLGVTRAADGRWDSEGLHLGAVEGAPGPVTALALAGDGSRAILALATPERIALLSVDAAGETAELARVEAPAAVRLALATRGELIAVGWLDGHGNPGAAWLDDRRAVERLEAPALEGRVQDVAVGVHGAEVVLAVAGPSGVRARAGEREGTLSTGPADEVALDTGGQHPLIAWSSPDGVWWAPSSGDTEGARLLDDGRRPGEPAHRIGAALELTASAEGPVAAYQDQTAGAVVIARWRDGEAVRRTVSHPRHTRGMHVALVPADGPLFVLDLGARSAPEPVMTPFVTAVPLR